MRWHGCRRTAICRLDTRAISEIPGQLAVPRLLVVLCLGRDRYVRQCLTTVDQPSTTEKLLARVLEHLEEHDVDRGGASATVASDLPFRHFHNSDSTPRL
jgi:hypothetical protein